MECFLILISVCTLFMYDVHIQALVILSEVGDLLSIKYSSMPVPTFSENDEDFRER